MKLTLAGAMVGVPAALIATRLIGAVMPGVTAAAPVTYAGGVGLLAASAF